MRTVTKTLALLAVLVATPTLHAEEKAPTIARKMIRADELPFGDVKKLAPAQVMLPGGAKEGGGAPSSWSKVSWDTDGLPNARCFDGRASSVEVWEPEVRTMRIVSIDGKDFLDSATVDIKSDKIKVKEATRTPVMKVVEATANVTIWGYRRQGEHGAELVLVAAVDDGVFDRAVGYGCSLREFTAALPTQTTRFDSSATRAYETAQRIWDIGQEDGKKKPGKRPTWVGENYRVEVSTSKSSADPAPMLSLYVRR